MILKIIFFFSCKMHASDIFYSIVFSLDVHTVPNKPQEELQW